MMPGLKDVTYGKTLIEMDLPMLEERREGGDLITLYKLTNGFEETEVI